MSFASGSTRRAIAEAAPHGLELVASDVQTGRTQSRFDRYDIVISIFFACLTFAMSLRMGYGRTLWEDEVLGWTMLRDPSWRHMFFS